MLHTLIRLTVLVAVSVNLTIPAFAEAPRSTETAPSAEAASSFPPRHMLPKELQHAPWLPKEERSSLLPVLFVSYSALQALDIRSTMSAIQNGAREANPLMGTGNVGTRLAVKAATSAATIWLAHRVAKKNKKAAIVTMIVANGITAGVVAYNYRNAARR